MASKYRFIPTRVLIGRWAYPQTVSKLLGFFPSLQDRSVAWVTETSFVHIFWPAIPNSILLRLPLLLVHYKRRVRVLPYIHIFCSAETWMVTLLCFRSPVASITQQIICFGYSIAAQMKVRQHLSSNFAKFQLPDDVIALRTKMIQRERERFMAQAQMALAWHAFGRRQCTRRCYPQKLYNYPRAK